MLKNSLALLIMSLVFITNTWAQNKENPNQDLINRFLNKSNHMINSFGNEFQEAINSKKFESVMEDAETFKDAYMNEMKKLIQQVEEKKVIKELGENYEKLKATIKNAQTILSSKEDKAAKEKEPYLKVLKNDKLALYNKDYIYYGSKKKQLITPEDMKNAKVWYEQGWNNSGKINESWVLIGYHFDENDKITETTEESGKGSIIPSSYFK